MSQEEPLWHPQPLAALPKKEDDPIMSQQEPLSHPQPLAALPKREDVPIMSQEEPLSHPQPLAALPKKEDGIQAGQEKTSDYYRIDPNLPSRFNHPGWFQGYRVKERNPLFRTTNMDYGGKPPTVHEMPTSFHVSPHAFTNNLSKFGKYINHGINTTLEKSYVTGPDNLITAFETFDFHPSYRIGGPSFCE